MLRRLFNLYRGQSLVDTLLKAFKGIGIAL